MLIWYETCISSLKIVPQNHRHRHTSIKVPAVCTEINSVQGKRLTDWNHVITCVTFTLSALK